jgi:outer membrane lipoprotein carrier protein
MKPKLLLLLLLIAPQSFAQSATRPVDLHRLAESVDKHYNSLSTLETQFTEEYRGGGMARTESGTMWIKKPGKMLWQYSAPRQKLFLTDGKTAWFYVPGEKQARRASVKNLDDLRSPLRYLLGHSKLEKEFTALSLAPDQQPTTAGDIVLRGVPRGMEDRVSMVLLEVTPENRLSRIYIEELDGSQTDFRFKDQKENVAVADSRFTFKPPAGVEVMQATELQP